MSNNIPKPDQESYPADTLGMSPEEMKTLGYRVVDLVVERLLSRQDEAAIVTGSPVALRAELGGPIPEDPGDPEAALQKLAKVGLFHQQHSDHPRYFARVPGPSSFGAVLGEWLATGFNTIAASWGGGSGPATLELVVVDWLRQLMGMPKDTEGVLLSGGSMANLTAMVAARATCGDGVVYLSDQTHSSITQGLLAMGLPSDNLRVLASDENFRIPIRKLSAAIEEDQQVGRSSMMVVASAGTTNTGAIDPLHEIADLCEAHSIWFHIDGAYGAPAALTQEGKRILSGLERADSLVLDPHKWLFQPYDVGCTLVRRPGALQKAFSMTPEYLHDVKGNDTEVDFRDRSLELTRRSRAAKLWMSFHTYGRNRMRQAIEKSIALAEYAEKMIRDEPDVWELVTPAQLGIVTFALRGADDREHSLRVQRLSDTGYSTVSSTTLKGRRVLRLCLINPLTTEADIEGTLERLASLSGT